MPAHPQYGAVQYSPGKLWFGPDDLGGKAHKGWSKRGHQRQEKFGQLRRQCCGAGGEALSWRDWAASGGCFAQCRRALRSPRKSEDTRPELWDAASGQAATGWRDGGATEHRRKSSRRELWRRYNFFLWVLLFFTVPLGMLFVARQYVGNMWAAIIAAALLQLIIVAFAVSASSGPPSSSSGSSSSHPADRDPESLSPRAFKAR